MPFQRLPRTIIPLNYDIYVEPEWDKTEPEGYKCVTRIDIEVHDPLVKEVSLNSIGAQFISVDYEGRKALSLDQSKEDVDNELVRFRFEKPLGTGKGILTLEFACKFCDVAGLGMKGMYRSKCEDGTYHYLTFLAPTYARNVFPCFDEPDFKASFDISLVVPKGLVAASNMPLKDEKLHAKNEGWVIKRFERTLKMSTYLASWIIGEFDYLEDIKGSVPCRVYTPVGKKNLGRFALSIAAKALKFFADYFSIPYPLPKLDLVAFGDFPCGAMENWGLISFREMLLLFDEKESSCLTKLKVGTIVCHEIAHSWFGNLVTMKWWTDLWLNEGFATFMQVLCYDALEDQLNVWDEFQANMSSRARQLDSLSSSHAIEMIVESSSDIDEIFDDISYMKGASVIAMLHDWIGDATFRAAISDYLKQYSYENAETKDLWMALEKASGLPVKNVMDTWTKQKGYPLLKLSSFIRNDKTNKNDVSLECKLFRLEQCKLDEGSSSCIHWVVPLSLILFSENGSVSKRYNKLVEVFDGSTKDNVELEMAGTPFKGNANGVGFYRIMYTNKAHLAELGSLVTSKLLSSRDRINLLDDLFATAISGDFATSELLSFLGFFKNEDNYFVLLSVSDILEEMIQLFADDMEQLKQIQLLGTRLFASTAERLGWEMKSSDSDMDILLRSLAINNMVTYEDKRHIAEGKRIFANFESGSGNIPADLKAAVYKAALHDDASAVDRLLTIYRNTDLLEEKLRILSSFRMVKDKSKQSFLLQFAISEEVRMQDAVTVMTAISRSNAEGRSLTWNFFKINWELFRKQFTGLFIIANLVRGITENFTSVQMEKDVESFFQEHEFRGTRMSVQQALESIRINRQWMNQMKDN